MPAWIRFGIAGTGALLLIGGCWAFFSDAVSADVRRATQLAAVTPAQFQSVRVGTAVLLVGQLKALEPLGPQGFVVYTKEQFLRIEKEGPQKGHEQWMALSVPKPHVAVEDGGAAIPVCNLDYLMKNPAHSWQSDPVPMWHSVGDATIRLAGFKPGDSLTADGVIATSSGSLCLQTTVIFAGTKAQYLEALREEILVLKIVGLVFGGIGALMLAIVAKFSRARRTHSSPKRRSEAVL